MPSQQYRSICWTIFPVGDERVPELPHYVRYAVWQFERCKDGRLHWQGYMELSKSVTLTALHADFHQTAHFEERRGTRVQARNYCMDRTKPGVVLEVPVEEHGTWIKGQGHRSDLELATSVIVAGRPLSDVAAEYPETFVKYHRGLEVLTNILDKPAPDTGFVPRPWQQLVLNSFLLLRDDRKIGWIWDTDGNKGKSRFGNHLVREHGAIILSGRIADMAHGYNKHPIVVMDVPRTAAENVDHLFGFAEQLKNGMLFSTKYESCMKTFKPPIVLFMANFPCPPGKWSVDRLIEFNLDDL